MHNKAVNTTVTSYKQLLAGVLLALWSCFTGVMAAPEGGVVVAGDGSIAIDGDKTTVTQNSSDLVVDWDSFNVGQQEHVHFQQQQTSDSVLNRIYDSRPSEIWGKITARGNVWLLNPNGVFFSRTSRVSTGGLIAAGLWMEQQDFMSGRYVLNNSRGVGDVSNAGTLEATASGIGLAGGTVNNSGTIRASTSTVSLASGEQVAVDFAGDGLLRFAVESSLADASIDHSGSIEAAEVELSTAVAGEVFSGVINTSGVITARSIDGSGGNVVLQAGEIEHRGEIDADGTTGGEVLLQAQKNLLVSGSISARGKKGDGGLSTEQTGGSIRLLAERVTLGSTAVVDTDGSTGGEVLLQAGKDLLVSGSISARGKKGDGGLSTEQTGGSIRLLAERVKLGSTAVVDASGDAGGGEVLAGGGWQGNDPAIMNAEETTVIAGAIIRANANIEGDGGIVVVWSDGTTRYAGHIEARGGAQGGDGGEAEVSGKENLQVQGFADLTAPNGESGHFLLDPGTVRICDGPVTGCANDPAAPATPLNTFTDDYVQTQLGMGDVTILTSAASTGPEDINIDSGVSIVWSANTWTFNAGNDINLGGTLDASGSGILALNFGNMLSIGSATLSGSITATGDGTSTLVGPDANTDWIVNGASVTVGGVAMTLSMVSNLQGGSMADTFMITGASTYDIEGRDGNDVFNIAAVLTGSLHGGLGSDTFRFNSGGEVLAITAGSGTDLLDLGALTASVMIRVTGYSDNAAAGHSGYSGYVTGGIALGGAAGRPGFSGIDEMVAPTVGGDSFTGMDSTENDFFLVQPSVDGDHDALYRPLGSRISTELLLLTGIDNFIGGRRDDVFLVERDHSGNLHGGGGSDDFTFNTGGSVSGIVDGGAGTDTFSFAGGTVSGVIVGGLGEDFLDLGNHPDEVVMIALSGVPDIGTGVGASASGYSGYVAGGVNLGDATTAGFNGINSIIISGSLDTASFTGIDEASIFSLVRGPDFYEVNGYVVDGIPYALSLSGIDNYIGGSEADLYVVAREHRGDLHGGGGDDVFNLYAAVTGDLDGGAGDDTFNFLMGSNVRGMVNGGAGVDIFTLSTVVNGDLYGDSGNDFFQFLPGGSAGPVTVSPYSSLRGVLDGGAGDDTFLFSGGTAASVVAGGSGFDVMDFITMPTGGVIISLSGRPDIGTGTFATAVGFSGYVAGGITLGDADAGRAGFSGINSIRGSATTSDSFTGIDEASTFDLDGVSGMDRYAVDSVMVEGFAYDLLFSGIDSYTGGSASDSFFIERGYRGSLHGGGGADTFTFNTGGSVSGIVAGGAGADILSYAARNTTVRIELAVGNTADGFAGMATDTGGFTGISNIMAGTAADDAFFGGGDGTLTGTSYTVNSRTLTTSGFENISAASVISTDVATTWIITGNTVTRRPDGGTETTLMDVTSLQGGSAVDTFMVTGDTTSTVAITLNGGGGADVFTLGATLYGSINGEAGDDIFNFDSDGAVMAVSGMSGSGGVDGGSGADSFIFAGGTVAGVVAGGLGDDLLNFHALSAGVMISLSGEPHIGSSTFATAEGYSGYVAGGATLGNADVGIAGFTGINAITATTTTDDSFTGIDVVGSRLGGFNLVADSDTAAIADTYTTGLLVEGSFYTIRLDGIDSYIGGNDGDLYAVYREYSGSLHGGDGADVFVLYAGGRITGMVDGGAGTDIFHLFATLDGDLHGGDGADAFNLYSGGSVTGMVDGGAGADIFNLHATLDGDLHGGDDADLFNLFAGGRVTGMVDGGVGGDRFNLFFGSSVDGMVAGGSGNDMFVFIGGTVTGTDTGAVAGGTGDDLLHFRALHSPVNISLSGVDIGDGTLATATGYSGYVAGSSVLGDADTGRVGFTGINRITGTASGGRFRGPASSFIGADQDSSFTLTADPDRGYQIDTYTVDTAMVESRPYSLVLDNIESYTGGSGNDNYIIEREYGGELYGGAGDDVFTLHAGGRVGFISGDTGDDILRGPDAVTAWHITEQLRLLPAVSFVVSLGGNAVTSSIGILSSIETFQGGSMADTFMVTNTVGRISAFRSVRLDIEGGGGADVFNISNELMGSLDGGTGDDTFNLNMGGRVSGSVTGGAGADTFYFNGGTVTGTVAGGADTDIVRGPDAATTWGVDGRMVSIGSTDLTLDSIETLQGGSMADTFMVTGASTYNLEGGGGADVFTLTAVLTGSLGGGSGADTFNLNAGGSVSGVVAGGTGVDVLSGGAGADVLSYAARTTTVQVELAAGADATGFSGTATDTGGFNGISSVIGGTATDDAFVGTADGSLTGTTSFTANSYTLDISGFDVFSVASSQMVVIGDNIATIWILTGNTVTQRLDDGTETTFMGVTSLTGGSEIDTFNIVGDTTSTVAITLNGGGGADVFNLDATLYGRINGDAGDDTVRFNNNGSVMAVTGVADSGVVDGGAGADMFIFAAGADTATGGIIGGANIDTLDFSAISDAITVALSGTPDGNGFGGRVTDATVLNVSAVLNFSGINTITGGSNTGDSLQGLNVAATWTLGAADTYAAGSQTLSFSALENLVGGSMSDAFAVSIARAGNLSGGGGADVFTLTAVLTGSLDGGAGNDIFNFNGGTVVGTVAGGADTDIVRGPDAATTWDIDGRMVSIGSTDLTLDSIETLQGGSMADTFMVTGASTYNLEGGGGADVFTLTAVLTGSLDGGAGNDTFNLNAGGSVSGVVAGGTGADVLSYAARTTTVQVELSPGAAADGFSGLATDTGGFSGISSVMGGTATDDAFVGTADGSLTGTTSFTANSYTLGISGFDVFSLATSSPMVVIGDNIATTWIITGNTVIQRPDDGGTEVTLMNVIGLQGGSEVDTFNVMADTFSTVAITLNGGGGADVFNLDATLYGSVNGGAGGDIFNFNSGGEVAAVTGVFGSGSVDGGAGTDSFVFAGGTVAGAIAGGLGHDLLDFSALPGAVEVAMGGRPDIGGGTVATASGFSGYVSGGAVLGDANSGIIGFSGINEITATAATGDTFAGLAEAGTFTMGPPDPDSGSPVDYYGVDAVTAGGSPYLLVLNGIEDYISGSESDSYVIQRAYSGDLIGGSGANSFTIDAPFFGNIMSLAGNDTIIIGNVITGNVDSGAGGDVVRLLPDGRVIGSLAMGEAGETATDVDVFDVSRFDLPLTLIYDADGGQAYVADGTYGPEDGVPDAVIMSDGQFDGMPGSGSRNGIYGAESIVGAPHNTVSGTYLVVQPVRTGSPGTDLYASDLAINGDIDDPVTDLSTGSSIARVTSPGFSMVSLILPDLMSFPSYVIIGGSGAPPFPLSDESGSELPLSVPGVSDDPMNPGEATVIQTRRLIIEGDIVLLGSLALLGSGVELQADIYTGVDESSGVDPARVRDRSGSEIAIVATGSSPDDFAGNGAVSSVMVAGTGRGRTIASGGGLIIASDTFMNAGDTVIDLGAGMLQFAQGAGAEPVSFGGGSSFAGVEVQEEINDYIVSGLGQTLVSVVLIAGNPASSLAQTGTVSADVSLFEEDLTLFSLIGKGISLYLSLCEQIEGCAPPVDLAEIESLLEGAKARLAELRLQLQVSSEYLSADLVDLVRRFEKVVQYMINLRREYLEIFGEGRFIYDNNEIYEVSLPYYKHIAKADTKASDDL